MKNSIGIVAEYNPFHNGHLLHLEKARKLAGADLPAVAVMSGSVVQRGEPAFCSKWLRARMAFLNGIDLVFELPAVFSCRSAEFFAGGAVRLLAATGIIKYLAFGAETADSNTLMQTASFIDTHQDELRAIIQNGSSYAAALSRLLIQNGYSFNPNQSNDILALEYCRSLQKYAPDITPLVIRRLGAAYNDTKITASYASAAAIRKGFAEGGLTSELLNQLPQTSQQLLQTAAGQNAVGVDKALLQTLILYKLRTMRANQISAACECTEGLEHRLKDAACQTELDGVLGAASNKRYTKTRISRLLMQLLLDTERISFTQAEPQYLRVLAFNGRGRQLLSAMKQTASLPVITKIGRNFKNCLTGNAETDIKLTGQLELDIKAANILALLQKGQTNSYNSDYTLQPFYIQA